ncbi:MAG: esterase/lipase family protein [Solirubrobacteraceae bacterium]
MRSTEVRAIGELAGRTLAGAGTMVRDLHMAVAERAFAAVGPGGAPARVVHDGVAEALYGGVRTALAAVPRGAGSAVARSARDEGPALAQSPRGSLALAALNAYVGDALHADDSPLALAMTVHHRGKELPLEPAALAAAVPDAGARVAVFVHGLGETHASWRLRADAQRPGYGACLRRDLGHTPLELRYNTGLHVSDNGRALAALLQELHEAWPVAIEEVVIVGHSMGGLVARSACHYGSVADHAWTSAVRHVFCLGSPHLGAPLEKGVNALGWALGRVPETRPLANLLGVRSAGIKDLRYGACVDEDWCDCDPDELLTDRCHDVPLLPGARFYFVAATLSGRPGDPLGALLGDLLVRVPSASGAGRRRKVGFAIEDGHHVGGLTHFDLLNHPAVYHQIRAWIER